MHGTTGVSFQQQLAHLAEESLIVLLTDESGRILAANSKGLEMFGNASRELIGEMVSDETLSLSENYENRITVFIEKAVASPKTIQEVHTEIRRGDGTNAWISWKIVAFPGENGAGGQVLCLGSEIRKVVDLEARNAVLYELAIKMTEERPSVEDILWFVAEKGAELIHADSACIAIKEDNPKRVITKWFPPKEVGGRDDILVRDLGLGVAEKPQGHGRWFEDFLNEAKAEPWMMSLAKEYEVVSACVVPVSIGNTLLGILYAFFSSLSVPNLADQKTLVSLGNMAAVTIQISRQYERSESIFKSLYDLILEMGEKDDIKEKMDLVVKKAHSIIKTDLVTLARGDELAGYTEVFAVCPEEGIRTKEYGELRVPLDKGLGGKVAQDGKGVIFQDYYKENFEHVPKYDEIWEREGFISGIVVPIQIGNRSLGRLWSINRFDNKDRVFTEAEKTTLELFANIAAIELSKDMGNQKLQALQGIAKGMVGK